MIYLDAHVYDGVWVTCILSPDWISQLLAKMIMSRLELRNEGKGEIEREVTLATCKLFYGHCFILITTL